MRQYFTLNGKSYPAFYDSEKDTLQVSMGTAGGATYRAVLRNDSAVYFFTDCNASARKELKNLTSLISLEEVEEAEDPEK